MADTASAKDELKNAGAHAKEALRATLLAARSALDIAIRRLDEEPEPEASANGATAADTAPQPEGSIDSTNS